jgi:hypothetical protein
MSMPRPSGGPATRRNDSGQRMAALEGKAVNDHGGRDVGEVS